MYEPITIAKVREPRTVTIPAGGWIVLGSPDQPLSDQIDRRAKLIKNGNVNDEYQTLLIGRLQDTHPVTRFVTKKESDAAAANHKNNQAALTQNIADAKTRQARMESDRQKQLEADHQARVAELNAENDAIRNRGAAPATGTETETQPEIPANEFTREELQTKPQGELLALVKTLVEAKRIEPPAKTSPTALIEAILAAKPVTQPTE